MPAALLLLLLMPGDTEAEDRRVAHTVTIFNQWKDSRSDLRLEVRPFIPIDACYGITETFSHSVGVRRVIIRLLLLFTFIKLDASELRVLVEWQDFEREGKVVHVLTNSVFIPGEDCPLERLDLLAPRGDVEHHEEDK